MREKGGRKYLEEMALPFAFLLYESVAGLIINVRNTKVKVKLQSCVSVAISVCVEFSFLNLLWEGCTFELIQFPFVLIR